MQRQKRRDFLAISAGALAASAMGGSAKASRNDVIRVACVGIRGRGGDHMEGFEELPNAEVTALCDVDSSVLDKGSENFQSKTGRKIKRFTDVRKLLEDKDIDVVSIATPNHWHALIGVWAMQNGKDVYIEKPCSHNVSEGRKLVETARNYQKICQHGTQSRSSAAVQEAIQFLREGGIGKVHTAKGLCYKWRASIGKKADGPVPKGVDYNLWLGPAPVRPFNPNRFHYEWHWNWDYGNGDIGNQGVHQMDVARWGLGKDHLPNSVFSSGGRFGYEDDGQTPNTQIATCDYGDCQLVFEVRGLPTNDEMGVKVGNIWYGSEGILVLGDKGWKTYYGQKNEPGRTNQAKGGKSHYANFIDAVVSRKRESLTADILEGHLSSALGHLANVAYRLGRKLEFDPKTERFGNDLEANAMLTREYRAPFVV